MIYACPYVPCFGNASYIATFFGPKTLLTNSSSEASGLSSKGERHLALRKELPLGGPGRRVSGVCAGFGGDPRVFGGRDPQKRSKSVKIKLCPKSPLWNP